MMSEDGTTMMLASVAPVPQAGSVVPPELDAAELLKAVGLADVARKAEEERAGRAAAARCDTGLGGLGRVKPWVREAARFLSCLYGEPTLIGVAGRSGQSDHPSGLAVDFMMRSGSGRPARRVRPAQQGGARRVVRDLEAADQLRRRLGAHGGPRR